MVNAQDLKLNYYALYTAILTRKTIDKAIMEVCGEAIRLPLKADSDRVSTEVNPDDIRKMRDEGMTLEDISRETGVSYSTVWRRLKTG